MIIVCPACKKKYRLDDSKRAVFVRQPRRCPKCGQLLEIFDDDSVTKAVVPGEEDSHPQGTDKHSNSLPETIGPYVIESLLGKGGMGSVYKAWEESLHRHVAVKVLAPTFTEDESSRRRFLIEARALAKLVHPNITQIYSADEEGNQPFFSMEFIVGHSTEKMLKDNGPFSVGDSLKIIREVCKGLGHAQKKGIIHRDIKPGNILVSEEGDVKITDFGIAKVASEDHSLTKTGMMVGTPAYISPEQAKGDELDFRSDIYSLGITLYEYLLGRPPFTSGSNMTVIVKHISEPVQFPLLADSTALPPPLTGIIRKMLAKNPAKRYLSYEHLLNDIEIFEQKAVGNRNQHVSESTEAARLTGMTTIFQPVIQEAEQQLTANLKKSLLAVAFLLILGLGLWQWQPWKSDAITDGSRPRPQVTIAPAAPTPEKLNESGSDGQPVQAADIETNVMVEQLPGNEYRIFGTLRNTGNQPMQQILVTINVIDEFQDVVAKKTSDTEPSRVLPGESTRFSTLFRGVDNFDHYQVTVEGVLDSVNR